MDIDIPTEAPGWQHLQYDCFWLSNVNANVFEAGVLNSEGKYSHRYYYKLIDGQMLLFQDYGTNNFTKPTGIKCLQTGDLVYKPEYKEFFFPICSVFVCLFIFWLAYRLMLHKWWRKI